jgi:hypothetical protein
MSLPIATPGSISPPESQAGSTERTGGSEGGVAAYRYHTVHGAIADESRCDTAQDRRYRATVVHESLR